MSVDPAGGWSVGSARVGSSSFWKANARSKGAAIAFRLRRESERTSAMREAYRHTAPNHVSNG